MSSKIIAQGVPQSINSFPGFKLPTRIRAVVDITGGAAVIRAAETTPGVTVGAGAGGVFDFLFPAGKQMGDVNPQVRSGGSAVAATRFFPVVDVSTTNTNATTGKMRVTTASTGAAAIPTNGDVLEVCWWMDYG